MTWQDLSSVSRKFVTRDTSCVSRLSCYVNSLPGHRLPKGTSEETVLRKSVSRFSTVACAFP